MTLLLHCGYHKTASSYLQSCFACRHDLLMKNGIHYPDDPRQKEAAKGVPTLGNGGELCLALLKQDGDLSRKLLRRYAAEAKRQGVKSVLLSTEGFFTCFSQLEVTNLFMELARQEGFERIRAIIFFRAPVEHAISVYCHRAASGKLPPFTEWLEKSFETPDRMNAFADNLSATPIEWDIRRFQPKIDNIAEVVLGQWLGIRDHLDLETLPSHVNVSISISEAQLLPQFQHQFPNSGRHVAEFFKAMPAKHKADESSLRRSYSDLTAVFFQRHLRTIEKVNRLLPPDQPLTIPPVRGVGEPPTPPVFSEAQVLAGAKGLLSFHQRRAPLKRFRRFLQRAAKPLGRLMSSR